MLLLHRCQDPIEFLHEYEGREEEMFEYFQTKCVTAYNASPVTRLNIPGWTTTEQHLFLNGVMVFVWRVLGLWMHSDRSKLMIGPHETRQPVAAFWLTCTIVISLF